MQIKLSPAAVRDWLAAPETIPAEWKAVFEQKKATRTLHWYAKGFLLTSKLGDITIQDPTVKQFERWVGGVCDVRVSMPNPERQAALTLLSLLPDNIASGSSEQRDLHRALKAHIKSVKSELYKHMRPEAYEAFLKKGKPHDVDLCNADFKVVYAVPGMA